MRSHSLRRRQRSRRAIPLVGLGTLAAVGPIGYPAWLAWTTRHAMPPVPPRPESCPAVSVVVPAYLEHSTIAAKVAGLRRVKYDGEVQIIVVADDPHTAQVARQCGVEVIESPSRTGKAAALNRGFAAAQHPIVVITDADTQLGPDTLPALARWFSDPQVGAVAGEKRIRDDHEGLYWRFEAWLKRRETMSGTTVGLVGEVAAIRRRAFRPLPGDLAVDDLWLALDVIEQGFRIVYDPSAIALERANERLREDWERRTRVVSGAFDVFRRRRRLLDPRRGRVAVELWGHRLLRQSAGPLSHAALLAYAVCRAKSNRAAAAFVGVHLIAAQALARSVRGASLSRPEAATAQVVFLQLVALGGMVRYLRRDRPALWPKSAR